MKVKYIMMLIVSLSLVFSYSNTNGKCYCGSCFDCTLASSKNSGCKEIILQKDIQYQTHIKRNKHSMMDNPEKQCINVLSNDLVINCQGHKIIGDNNHIGVNITERSNIQIKNCSIKYFDKGIYVSNSHDIKIGEGFKSDNPTAERMLDASTDYIHDNNYGIYITNGYKINISDMYVENNSNNLYISGGKEIYIFGNQFGKPKGDTNDTNVYLNVLTGEFYDNKVYDDRNSFNGVTLYTPFKFVGGNAANVIGGGYIGGNYWYLNNSKGFSENCSDSSYPIDICDSPNPNGDEYPLTGNWKPPSSSLDVVINLFVYKKVCSSKDIIYLNNDDTLFDYTFDDKNIYINFKKPFYGYVFLLCNNNVKETKFLNGHNYVKFDITKCENPSIGYYEECNKKEKLKFNSINKMLNFLIDIIKVVL